MDRSQKEQNTESSKLKILNIVYTGVANLMTELLSDKGIDDTRQVYADYLKAGTGSFTVFGDFAAFYMDAKQLFGTKGFPKDKGTWQGDALNIEDGHKVALVELAKKRLEGKSAKPILFGVSVAELAKGQARIFTSEVDYDFVMLVCPKDR